jgi:small subunit ribosomal protein S6
MRKYEVIFIVRPDVPEEEVDKLIAQTQGVVGGAGGTVEKVEKMGRRRLAYRIRKYREGFYVLLTLTGTGDTVKEVERRFKVTDVVIKYLSVRVDEDLKRAEKLKAMRAKQEAKRRRSKPAATPSGAGPSAPAAHPPVAGSAQA